MKQRVLKEYNPRSLAIMALLWSCFGGIVIGIGVDQLARTRFQDKWNISLSLGLVLLALGIFYGVMLVRRAKQASTSDEKKRKTDELSHLRITS